VLGGRCSFQKYAGSVLGTDLLSLHGAMVRGRALTDASVAEGFVGTLDRRLPLVPPKWQLLSPIPLKREPGGELGEAVLAAKPAG
jgi:hypothetical protein